MHCSGLTPGGTGLRRHERRGRTPITTARPDARRQAQQDAAPVLPEHPNRQERAMKMNSAQIERTLTKLNTEELSAEAIPAGHPMMPQLERLFGDHTYFLDSRGLSIVEPVEEGQADGKLGVVVNLASWADAS